MALVAGDAHVRQRCAHEVSERAVTEVYRKRHATSRELESTVAVAKVCIRDCALRVITGTPGSASVRNMQSVSRSNDRSSARTAETMSSGSAPRAASSATRHTALDVAVPVDRRSFASVGQDRDLPDDQSDREQQGRW